MKIQSNSSAESPVSSKSVDKKSVDTAKEWYVYMILCSDDSLYTGITTDVARRFDEHSSQKGAKYFRGRSPREIVFIEGGHSRSSASQREAFVKKLSRVEKLALTQSHLSSPGRK
jgi:putative endonuclease